METLDERLIGEVLSRLPAEDIVIVALVCKKWYQASKTLNSRSEFLISRLLARPYLNFPKFTDIESAELGEDMMKQLIDHKIPLRIGRLLFPSVEEYSAKKGLGFLGNMCLHIARLENESSSQKVTLDMLISQGVLDCAADMLFSKQEMIVDLALWCFANLSCSLNGVKLIQNAPSFPKFSALIKKENLPNPSTQRLAIWTLANMLREPQFQQYFVDHGWITEIMKFEKTEGDTKQQLFRCFSRLAYSSPKYAELVYQSGILENIKQLSWETYSSKLVSGALSEMERSFKGIYRIKTYKTSQSPESDLLEKASSLILELSIANASWIVDFLQHPAVLAFVVQGLQYLEHLQGRDWKNALWNLMKAWEYVVGDKEACNQLQEESIQQLLTGICTFSGPQIYQLSSKYILHALSHSKWVFLVAKQLAVDATEDLQNAVLSVVAVTAGVVAEPLHFGSSQLEFVDQVSEYLYEHFKELCDKRGPLHVAKLIEHAVSSKCQFEVQHNITRYVILMLIFGPNFKEECSWAVPFFNRVGTIDETALVDELVIAANDRLKMKEDMLRELEDDIERDTKKRKVELKDINIPKS